MLETLKDFKEIDGFDVKRVHWDYPKNDHHVVIYEDHNAITFKIQNGPIKENGVNGCQVDTMIIAAIKIIEGLNKKFPCTENAIAVVNLENAFMALKDRRRDREKRGVEGKNIA